MVQPQEIGRLLHNVPIVDVDGKPTTQFQRQWQLLQTQLAELQRRIAELEETP